MPSKSPIGSLMVKITLNLAAVELEEGRQRLTSMLTTERGLLVCMEGVAAQLIGCYSSQTMEGSLALMEELVGDPSLSTAAFFEEYLEDLALRSTALVSFVVIIHS